MHYGTKQTPGLWSILILKHFLYGGSCYWSVDLAERKPCFLKWPSTACTETTVTIKKCQALQLYLVSKGLRVMPSSIKARHSTQRQVPTKAGWNQVTG